MRILLFIFGVIFHLSVHSNEETSLATVTHYDVTNLSDIELLKKAESLKLIDSRISLRLANEALRLSESNHNHSISAKTHALLGELTRKNISVDASLNHHLQTTLIYKNINETENQITSTINYVELLLDEKRYIPAEKTINELLPVAKQYGDDSLLATLFIKKGDGYYQQKRFQEAIVQYTEATKYLSGNEQIVQHQLGETYKIIAQSYKRLKNREQTAYFYKKTLDVFTALQNKKLMARTLNTIAEAERYLGNLVVALDYSMQGLELHKELDDPEGFAKASLGAGIIYRHIGRYKKSLVHIHEAYLYYKKVNDELGIAKTSNQIGLLYSRLKQFDEAKSFYQLTTELSEGKIEDKTLASALRELAVINLQSGDYESAMAHAQKAHLIYKRNELIENQSVTARIIGHIYRAQTNESKAIEHYRESLSLARELNSKLYLIKSLNPLADILIKIDIHEAVNLLEEALILSNEISDKTQKVYVYRNFSEAEKARGNFYDALSYAEKERDLLAVIQKENDDNQLTLAKANLYSHKMELELEALKEQGRLDALLLTQKNNEIEIANQVKTITELQLIKNEYASISLILLLIICVLIIVFIYRRFTVSRKLNIELDYLAKRDPLTECYNRRILFKLLKQNFVNKEQLEEYCIIMADIDHFKDINDNHGHNIGDVVLSRVAEILRHSVRKNDIVARFGGEEFCIVLHNVNDEQAFIIAENMRRKIENSSFEGISVTSSFGVTSIRFNAKNHSELIDQADRALYKSKSHGRNQVTLWDPSL